MNRLRLTLTGSALALLLGATPIAFAQSAPGGDAPQPATTEEAGAATDAANGGAVVNEVTSVLPNFRPYDRRGLTTFEAPKVDALGYRGPALRWGVGFTQQFQALDHSNAAQAVISDNGTPTNPADDYNVNELMVIGAGANLAAANLNLDAILAPGIRVNLATYLSSRHHQEAWVKGGYIQVDELSFLGVPALDRVMDFVTLKIGHMEINYGDAHFRRTDNGNAFHNPFVGNYIMDAFTTEAGAEVYARHAGFLGMVGVTTGELNPNVLAPDGRSYSVYGKLGVDRQLTDDVRVRLTGSIYGNNNASRMTLFGGDRAGSRYWYALENIKATSTAQASSGMFNPNMNEQMRAIVFNPFVKVYGLELFGNVEFVHGRNANEVDSTGASYSRNWTQLAVDAVYRFLPQERAFVGARYNVVSGPLAGAPVQGVVLQKGLDVEMNRLQIGAGWFPIDNLLIKAEYVRANYEGFAPTDIRHGGEFNGFMFEGVLAF